MLKKLIFFSVSALIAIYLATDHVFYEEDTEDDDLTLFNSATLSSYDGKIYEQLYLSILGQVFDVTSGSKHYGPGASYNFFVGKDATRNFVDGNFECEINCDDIIGLSAQELRALDNWLKFYEKSYTYVGKLVGRYYDVSGNLTPYGRQSHISIKNALEDETEEDRLKMRYPGCNMEWDLDRGSHFWCSDQSGGIKRNWIGVPRKLFAPGSKKFRCACIKEEDLKINNIKEYDHCNPNSVECFEKQ